MADLAEPGIVEWYGGGERPGHRCGYCKNPSGNVSDGMWAHRLAVQDYQDLIDRGWRRSGKYCYKPKMDIMCCPHYTIKQEVLNFKISKSHKKIIKQFNRFIIHGKKRGEHDTAEEAGDRPKTEEPMGGGGAEGRTKEEAADNQNSQETDKVMETDRNKKTPKPGLGADPTKPKCKKAKELRKERKLAKQTDKPQPEKPQEQLPPKQTKSGEKTLEDLLNEPDKVENCAHKLEIRLVRSEPASPDFTQSFEHAHSVYHSYQMKIHMDPPEKPNVKQYTRFLCNSPLQEEHREGGLPMGYGSFHQQYWLDGQIIAVGVIDILPNCVSSVYLYYDPDYDFLSLGTYSALREIAFVRELNKKAPDLIYYYMGFYIHSCPKMRYKGQYFPSFLLCPEVYSWHPIEECVPKLDESKYSRFAESGKEDEDGNLELDEVMVLHRRMMMSYGQYKQLNPQRKESQDTAVRKYAGFVGQDCARRMLLYRD
ncbi:arginyl-tRNA--protein transferase 1-like isoform X2 [Ostrea edulis]|uniref:arginyl-tRNA--protein transferase 1-like isoform X2 n=1 Tax=Ostrea edulis TaxID=37623 RepID=UPI0024AF222E|nr:arginyl-tRNA--protein transferase 1-like isoform X2 [Ostrea edulis]